MGKNKHPVECSCQRTEREKQEALINQQKHNDLMRRLKAEGFSDPAMLNWTFYQLMISGGDVKAVQGTTGHATADMLVNTYAHIQQSSRVELGKKFEEGFYAKQESPQPAGCTRQRRTDHFYDRPVGTSEERRPRSKGAAPSGSSDLMQNLPHISRQFQPMQRIPTKKPTVQKPCIDRADPELSGLHNEKERRISRFNALLLVHLQGLEPWAH